MKCGGWGAQFMDLIGGKLTFFSLISNWNLSFPYSMNKGRQQNTVLLAIAMTLSTVEHRYLITVIAYLLKYLCSSLLW